MSTERRLFLFLVLSLLILLVFSRFFSRPLPQKPQDSAKISQYHEVDTDVQFQKPMEDKGLRGEVVETEMVETEVAETEDYVITFCNPGGYIKELRIKKYEEVLLYENLLLLPAYSDKEFEINKIRQGFRLILKDGPKQVIKEIRFIGPYLWEVSVTASPLSSHLGQLQIFTQKKDKGFYSRYQEVFFKEEEMKRLYFTKVKKLPVLSPPSLIGARDRYYAASLLNPPQGDYFFTRKEDSLLLIWKPQDSSASFKVNIFLGPQDIKILKELGIEEVINFGFFHGIGMVILNILHFFFSVFKNWGISIIFISTLIYLCLFPLTAKSTKSIKRMQELQPKIEELRKKYKENPQKLNKEVLGLYKEYKVNPLGGCLPMFLQIPIFISLYQVLNRSVEIKGANFLWIKDLSRQDYLIRFPFSLPIIGDGLHILPLIMVFIMVMQQKFTSPQAQSSEQQKMMSIMFPLIFGVIFYNFPSGLVLYWLCNSTFTFLYQLRVVKARAA